MLDRILEFVRAVAPHAEIQKREGRYYAVCPPEEQAAADAAIAAFDDSPEAEQRWKKSQALEAAAVIVETIDETTEPTLLAVRELVMVLMIEIQAIKGSKPKPSKTWAEHKADTAASLRAQKPAGGI